MSTPTIFHKWAPWWTPKQARCFLNDVEGVIKARYGKYRIDELQGTVTICDNDCVLGLSNLAQTCRRLDPNEWRLTIYSHMARLDEFSPDLLTERLNNYEQIRPDLRVRIVSTQHLDHIDAVCTPLPLGLFASLSLKLNDACCPIDRSYMKRWRVSKSEVMAIGLTNTLMEEPLMLQEKPSSDKGFYIFGGDSLFVSGHILDFARNTAESSSWGAVIAVPAAHTIMVCPISFNSTFIDASASMLAASHLCYLTGPNSVSPNALWWRPNQQLEPFARIDIQGFELLAPMALRKHLRQIPEAD
ncbi:MAG: hypothetical protein F4X48_03290 [Acidimicrobiia bacterium]|nr:hypothetical protein [Acidimicrobiia bacterium]MYC57600.1 hypothetical protein [Acidimicrobiia bacterium]MYI31269.1 hypothetical protein [Acidimicrobiia bacterium]